MSVLTKKGRDVRAMLKVTKWARVCLKRQAKSEIPFLFPEEVNALSYASISLSTAKGRHGYDVGTIEAYDALKDMLPIVTAGCKANRKAAKKPELREAVWARSKGWFDRMIRRASEAPVAEAPVAEAPAPKTGSRARQAVKDAMKGAPAPAAA